MEFAEGRKEGWQEKKDEESARTQFIPEFIHANHKATK